MVVQFVAGPEQAVGDEVQITRVRHGFVVVADGGGEDAGFVLIGVDPGHHEIIGALWFAGFVLDHLRAVRQCVGGGKHLDVVVMFFVDGGPVGQPGVDGMRGVGEVDGDGFLRTVPAGLQAEVFVPMGVFGGDGQGFGEIAEAVAVHGAMEVHAGNAGAVRREHALNHRRVLDIRRAFIVDHHIVALGVIGMAVDGQGGMGIAISHIDDIHGHIRAGFEALLEDVLLLGVIVAAAAGDEQGLERRGGLRRGQRAERQGAAENQQAREESGKERAGSLHGCY